MDNLTFKQYAEETAKTAIYPRDKAFDYLALAIAGEAAENLEKVLEVSGATGSLDLLLDAVAISIVAGRIAESTKKMIRDDNGIMTPERLKGIHKELGDLLYYIDREAYETGVTLEQIAAMNMTKISRRMEQGKTKGNGDNREADSV